MLYIRMLLTLIISLYTSRIVLKELGIVDYGIYNVVGGLITIFSFINGSMAQATQRFITYELGCGQTQNICVVFSTSVFVHLFIAILVILLGETLGLWYLYHYMIIPPDRLNAAEYIYQFSILIAAINIITVPYNALIIAHEKMTAFAYLSILEVSLKLVVAYIIVITSHDKLIVYGWLLLIIAVLMRVIYGIYARKRFSEVKIVYNIDWQYLKKMGEYASWSLWGSLAAAGMAQGINLMINAFFNPAINAARGVAIQVQSVVRNFASNVQTAINPQITKSYASHDNAYLYTLVIKGSLFSFFLYLLISLPVFLEIGTLLRLWLVEVPAHTSNFIRIMLLISAIEVLSSPLNVSVQATGNIKKFELTVSFLLLAILPISYLVLKISSMPENIFLVYLFISVVVYFVRLILAKKLVGIPLRLYINNVILKILLMLVIILGIPVLLHYYITHEMIRVVVVSISCMIIIPCCLYFIGLDYNDRKIVRQKIQRYYAG